MREEFSLPGYMRPEVNHSSRMDSRKWESAQDQKIHRLRLTQKG